MANRREPQLPEDPNWERYTFEGMVRDVGRAAGLTKHATGWRRQAGRVIVGIIAVLFAGLLASIVVTIVSALI